MITIEAPAWLVWILLALLCANTVLAFMQIKLDKKLRAVTDESNQISKKFTDRLAHEILRRMT